MPGRPGSEPIKLSDDGMIPVNAAAVSPDGSVLAAAYADGVVRVWDVKTVSAAGKK